MPSPGSPDPELVEQYSPYGVVLVVAGAAGDEVGLVGCDGGQPDGEVGELAVEPGPASRYLYYGRIVLDVRQNNMRAHAMLVDTMRLADDSPLRAWVARLDALPRA